MITNTTAEAVDQGFVKLENYVPVFSQGDSCWMVIALTGKDKDNRKRIGGFSFALHIRHSEVGAPCQNGKEEV
jgi:hypothetical protein